ncbi:hypothetical protein A6g_14220 [Bacillus velezensis]|nr:hypothetical protein A6g_14220 [Bacillus velezensis]
MGKYDIHVIADLRKELALCSYQTIKRLLKRSLFMCVIEMVFSGIIIKLDKNEKILAGMTI